MTPRTRSGSLVGRCRATVALSLLGLALAGCGERTFTEEEFIDEVNAQGAGIEAGQVIATNQDGVEIREVTLTESEPSPTGSQGDVHARGAMLVLEDAGAAEDELSRCESAPSLTCFRAANVVLRFEDIFPEDSARIAAAFQALAE